MSFDMLLANKILLGTSLTYLFYTNFKEVGYIIVCILLSLLLSYNMSVWYNAIPVFLTLVLISELELDKYSLVLISVFIVTSMLSINDLFNRNDKILLLRDLVSIECFIASFFLLLHKRNSSLAITFILFGIFWGSYARIWTGLPDVSMPFACIILTLHPYWKIIDKFYEGSIMHKLLMWKYNNN